LKLEAISRFRQGQEKVIVGEAISNLASKEPKPAEKAILKKIYE
jgi:hypothetical protein